MGLEVRVLRRQDAFPGGLVGAPWCTVGGNEDGVWLVCLEVRQSGLEVAFPGGPGRTLMSRWAMPWRLHASTASTSWPG